MVHLLGFGTLVNGSSLYLGWARRVYIAGPGHRLPYARVSRLAPYSTARMLAATTPPEERAALTLEVFTEILVRWIVNVYHQTPHRGLNGCKPQI